ncbi:ankyrin repeat domain-containing protein [Rickettsia asembonensis]|uniref:ankyrin repeat domain-containing protein n=1 Tax=Rickettsia asembonensis TaxID=1068590 RepID=UPI00397C81CF
MGNTTLYQAVTHNRFEIVKILIEHPKINVNETNLYGNTPLHQANNYNYFPIVELLLSHKDINIHKKNSHNDTPLDLATNKPEIFKLFNDYKESHKVSTISQDQEVQILGEEYNCNAFDGA